MSLSRIQINPNSVPKVGLQGYLGDQEHANEIREDGSHIVSMPRMGGLHHRYELAA